MSKEQSEIPVAIAKAATTMVYGEPNAGCAAMVEALGEPKAGILFKHMATHPEEFITPKSNGFPDMNDYTVANQALRLNISDKTQQIKQKLSSVGNKVMDGVRNLSRLKKIGLGAVFATLVSGQVSDALFVSQFKPCNVFNEICTIGSAKFYQWNKDTHYFPRVTDAYYLQTLAVYDIELHNADGKIDTTLVKACSKGKAKWIDAKEGQKTRILSNQCTISKKTEVENTSWYKNRKTLNHD